MEELPLRRSAGQPQLRSQLQARLPDLPHAAELRRARHRPDPVRGRPAGGAAHRPGLQPGPGRPAFYSHHFVGGNAYITRLLGADISGNGTREPYPELSVYDSSDDPTSVYHHAYFETSPAHGPRTQHDRMAWDRLRNVLTLDVPARLPPTGTSAPFDVTVANTGSGHNFPSGFPEGRNAWLSVRAWDVATGDELKIFDSFWNRTLSAWAT